MNAFGGGGLALIVASFPFSALDVSVIHMHSSVPTVAEASRLVQKFVLRKATKWLEWRDPLHTAQQAQCFLRILRIVSQLHQG